MFIEINMHYSQKDIAKRCWGCKYLNLYDEFNGKCECKDNRIKIRDREITSKACICKENKKEDAQ